IVGWDEKEFDDVLMAQAAEHDIGVILPFQLDATLNYRDAKVRKDLLESITRRVELYKDNPSLRMWGLGNEVVHGMIDPRGPRALAFAEFLVIAADRVRELDPNHPVIYRDAEDSYLAPVANALAVTRKARPWFVYGMNFFTNRLEDALNRGPTTR